MILSSFGISALENFFRYGYIYMMQVDQFFLDFKVFNIFGTFVLEPIVVSIVFVSVTIIFALLLHPIQKRKQVS
ncbi:hypothetical protein EPK97_12390 [Chengkuizengella sediminis]|nr:hypothetical protein [Chengkuizengella sediminis]